MLRWLPAAILVLVAGGASAAVVQLDDPDPPRSSTARDDVVTLDAPVLSLRRDLEPLRRTAADRLFRRDLDGFLATQPPDTCLQVRAGTLDYDHRVDDPQVPASLQKLLTATAALETIDPAYRFVTEVAMVGTPSAGGEIVGDLFLRGGGDPILATAEYMARERNQPQLFTDIDVLADAIVAAGVRSVTGAVVGDESRFDTERYNPAWPQRFVTQSQSGPLSALTVNDGFAYYPGVDRFGAADDPAAYAADVLMVALKERGVAFGAPARSGTTPPEAASIAAVESPAIGEVVAQMLRESDNNTAELLVKELGAQVLGTGTTAAGVDVVRAALADAGVDVEAVAVLDGSGLAPGNAVSCDLVSGLFDHDMHARTIIDALPVAGESGTLARRFTRPEVSGRIRAKTGTLNQVTALAGVALTSVGDEARFSLVANVGPDERIAFEVIAAQEQLADLLVSYPRLPDVDAFRPG